MLVGSSLDGTDNVTPQIVFRNVHRKDYGAEALDCRDAVGILGVAFQRSPFQIPDVGSQLAPVAGNLLVRVTTHGLNAFLGRFGNSLLRGFQFGDHASCLEKWAPPDVQNDSAQVWEETSKKAGPGWASADLMMHTKWLLASELLWFPHMC